MSWRNDLEIIGHHVKTGGVWAGDQIDKQNLRKLRVQGYIGYDDARGVYVATVAGHRAWARWWRVYTAWGFVLRCKWRVKKLLLAIAGGSHD